VRDLVDSTGGGIFPPLNESLLETRLKRELPTTVPAP
jgi:hypothetical protein